MEKENLKLDRLKIIGELKHYKRKKKNRTVNIYSDMLSEGFS